MICYFCGVEITNENQGLINICDKYMKNNSYSEETQKKCKKLFDSIRNSSREEKPGEKLGEGEEVENNENL